MPTSPPGKNPNFSGYVYKITAFAKGPMWASAPTRGFFDTLKKAVILSGASLPQDDSLFPFSIAF